MEKWYMTGHTRCRNMENAVENVQRFGKPAVIRQDGKFLDVTRLTKEPVQPGQFPFKIRDNEQIFNH